MDYMFILILSLSSPSIRGTPVVFSKSGTVQSVIISARLTGMANVNSTGSVLVVGAGGRPRFGASTLVRQAGTYKESNRVRALIATDYL